GIRDEREAKEHDPTQEHEARAMKIPYLMAALAFTLGLGFLVWGTACSDDVTHLGMIFHPRIAWGVGLIALLLSVITLLGLYGSSVAPTRAERRTAAARSAIQDRYRTLPRDDVQRTHATGSPPPGCSATENEAQEKMSRPAKYTTLQSRV